jgi:ribonuclease T2
VSFCRTLAAFLLFALSTADLDAQQRKQPQPGDFSYYLLALSYAPDFCAQPTGQKDPRECGAGRKLGFVVHGLWPQNNTGRGPENCGGSPVSQAIVSSMLSYIPSESLIQHEWRAHGTCSGLSVSDYFALIRKARDSVKIPIDLQAPLRDLHLTPSEIAARFAVANPGYARGAFRVSCYRDGELQEVRICLNKDLSPRACGGNLSSCGAQPLELRAVR